MLYKLPRSKYTNSLLEKMKSIDVSDDYKIACDEIGSRIGTTEYISVDSDTDEVVGYIVHNTVTNSNWKIYNFDKNSAVFIRDAYIMFKRALKYYESTWFYLYHCDTDSKAFKVYEKLVKKYGGTIEPIDDLGSDPDDFICIIKSKRLCKLENMVDEILHRYNLDVVDTHLFRSHLEYKFMHTIDHTFCHTKYKSIIDQIINELDDSDLILHIEGIYSDSLIQFTITPKLEWWYSSPFGSGINDN